MTILVIILTIFVANLMVHGKKNWGWGKIRFQSKTKIQPHFEPEAEDFEESEEDYVLIGVRRVPFMDPII